MEVTGRGEKKGKLVYGICDLTRFLSSLNQILTFGYFNRCIKDKAKTSNYETINSLKHLVTKSLARTHDFNVENGDVKASRVMKISQTLASTLEPQA